MSSQDELAGMHKKLNAFSIILRLGHEAFDKKSLAELGMHITNNSRIAVPFSRSCLIDLRDDNPNIVGQTSQMAVNPYSEYNQLLRTFFKLLKDDFTAIIRLSPEFIAQQSPAVQQLWSQLSPDASRAVYLVPMRPPVAMEDANSLMVWMIEFDAEPPIAPEPVITLLTKHYTEALWSMAKAKHEFMNGIFKRKYSAGKVFAMISVVFLLALVVVRIPQTIVADFAVVPNKSNIAFAPYDGIIDKCYIEDGREVRKGDLIISYSTEQLSFQLAAAEADFNEASAELDRISREAFSDKQLLSRIKSLEVKKQRAKVAIDECQWYLNKSKLYASTSGLLSLATGNTDKISGKPVKTGEKLFEVFSGEQLLAEIEVNEKDASVLEQLKSATLYLHTSPEYPISGDVIFVGSQPILTDRNTFCYILRAKFKDTGVAPRYGMRGIASLSGPRVSLGYYLFRSAVLWWRQL